MTEQSINTFVFYVASNTSNRCQFTRVSRAGRWVWVCHDVGEAVSDSNTVWEPEAIAKNIKREMWTIISVGVTT